MNGPIPNAARGPRDRTVAVVQGEYHISRDPSVVLSTVLGSCVSACIYDADGGIGGLNHFLLPGDERGGSAEMKYGSMAMELLINEMLKAGARRTNLKVKLYGGGRITAGLSDIGAKNIDFARGYCRREGFPVVSESLGGTQARRIHFRPSTGEVRLTLVAQTQAPKERVIAPRKPAADVTLF
ncbi:chemotaxis protein CheD [Rhodobacterales bacterium HKCCE2091]|nr:chemotaxis protein CheD [Rhodobacterales bacterium HKCCE2091]